MADNLNEKLGTALSADAIHKFAQALNLMPQDGNIDADVIEALEAKLVQVKAYRQLVQDKI